MYHTTDTLLTPVVKQWLSVSHGSLALSIIRHHPDYQELSPRFPFYPFRNVSKDLLGNHPFDLLWFKLKYPPGCKNMRLATHTLRTINKSSPRGWFLLLFINSFLLLLLYKSQSLRCESHVQTGSKKQPQKQHYWQYCF